ncbi:MAG: hypothetical protein ACQEUH_15120 [Pseudomonadota bacterium]
MGLDVGFYHQGEELFYFRNHREFFGLFDDAIGGRVSDEYDDFYVTEDTLDEVEAELRAWLLDAKLTEQDMVTSIPDWFWDDPRDLTSKEMLRHYPAVVQRMREAVEEHGCLVCGYSA